MRSTGRSSPFPSNGGAVPNGSPARRQFGSEESAAIARSIHIDGPPGPSSETVLNGLLPSLRGGGAAPHPTTLRSSSRAGVTSSSSALMGPSQLMEAQAAARVAPARVRATPEAMLNVGGSGGGRPPSAPSYGRRAASAMGSVDNTAAAVRMTPFEEEIFAIGRLNKVLPERGNLAAGGGGGGDSRSQSSMGGGGGIPTLSAGVGGSFLNTSAVNNNRTLTSSSLGNTSSAMMMGGSGSASGANPWLSASHAGKKGTHRNAPLRSVQPSPTFGEHDLTTEVCGGNTGMGTISPSDINNFTVASGTMSVNSGGGAASSSFAANNNATTYASANFYQGEAPAGEDEEHPNRTATNKPIHVPYAPDIRPAVGGMKTQAPRQPLILKDYIMIAEACQRASRVRIEGAAYYKIGELYAKNRRDTLHKAVPYFKKYLNISRRLQDVQGECKALNVLGCTYYALMNHSREMGGRSREELIAAALEFHQEHANIADAAGLFIAQTNMGLCYRALGELDRAAECYKSSMQFAVRSGDRVAEALALSNLSDVGTAQGDVQTAQVCVERNLEIAAATRDSRVGCESYEQLGTLAMLKGDYASATEAYLMGLEVALGEGDAEKASELRCKIGLVQGKMRMQEQMAHAIKRMTPH